MRGSELGQGENGIMFDLDMSGEMHMWRRSEVFGCIPHGRGALTDSSMGPYPMEGPIIVMPWRPYARYRDNK